MNGLRSPSAASWPSRAVLDPGVTPPWLDVVIAIAGAALPLAKGAWPVYEA
jgi:hypothetical protein